MSLKSFVNNAKDWKEFNDWIDGEIEKRRKTLETATDELSIRRYQGRIAELRDLKRLRDILNGPEQK